MTPFEAYQTIKATLDAAIPGARVVALGMVRNNTQDDQPWISVDINHISDQGNDAFGEDDVQQRMQVAVTAFSAADNPERALQLAEEARSALAGLHRDDLSLGAGRFADVEAPDAWYGLSVVFSQAVYAQGS